MAYEYNYSYKCAVAMAEHPENNLRYAAICETFYDWMWKVHYSDQTLPPSPLNTLIAVQNYVRPMNLIYVNNL